MRDRPSGYHSANHSCDVGVGVSRSQVRHAVGESVIQIAADRRVDAVERDLPLLELSGELDDISELSQSKLLNLYFTRPAVRVWV